MKTYKEVIKEAEKTLEESGNSFYAKYYMFELLNEKGKDLYSIYDDEIAQDIESIFSSGVKRLLNEEPLSYILGYTWFLNHKIYVDNRVLIPRPETEELMTEFFEVYDNHFSDKEEVVVIDVGTGSGAIAVCVKKEEPKCRVYGSDISADALEVAKYNAKQSNIEIEFLEGSMLDPFIEKNIKANIILCNPPYIKSNESLEKSVKDFEPHLALFGGEDGLKYYREVFENTLKVINDQAFLIFEIGYDQREALLNEVDNYFDNASAKVNKDLSGNDRFLIVEVNR